jgi:hypothetical protein
MKKNSLIYIVLCFFAVFITFGCKSAPEEAPVPEVENTEEVVEVVPDPVPVVQPEVVESEVEEDSSPDYIADNQALEKSVLEARNNAIAAGAQLYFPDELGVIDVAAIETQTVYKEGGSPEDFNKKATDLLYMYKAIEQACFAAADWEKINGFDFAQYNTEAYESGNQSSEKVREMFKSGSSGKEIYDEVLNAVNSYDSVLYSAYLVKANEEKTAVTTIKNKADEIKASVSEKANYQNAVVFYTQAESDLVADKPEVAYSNFVKSHTMFREIYDRVFEKRQAAEEAIARAKARTQESDTIALSADEVAPLEEIEGESQEVAE